MGLSSYPRSAVLVLSQSSIYSLLPPTLFAQVDSLLRNGRLVEAQALLERTEVDVTQGSTSSSDQTLRYFHQCLAFAFMRQTRFREATTHFVKGSIDPRVPVSYFDELRPALFIDPPSHGGDGSTTLRGVERDCVEVEIWDGVREYMPDETSVDDIIAINLVRNYSPYLRPGAILEHTGTEPSTSDSHTKSGTRTHSATVAMREVLRGEASEMVKSILAAVLDSAEMWSRDVIEITSTALALLHAHAGDIHSLLALFSPPPSAPPNSSSRPVSRSSSRPPSRPASTSHAYPSDGHQTSIPSLLSHTRHTSHTSQTTSPNPPGSVLPFRPEILAPVLSQMERWGALVEMWKVCGDGGKVVDILAGVVEGTYIDPFVVDPLGQIFSILAPARTDSPTSTIGTSLSLSEYNRSSLVKKWAAWLAGKDVERGLKLLTSSQPARHRRPTAAAGRGRDKADRERDAQKADELVILSELWNTNAIAAKRYLEWLVVGRGLGRRGKEAPEEELFEELVQNCVGEVLEYVEDEGVGRLWRAKAASYASSLSTSAATPSPPLPPPKSDSSPSPIHTSPPPPLRSSFMSYFASTTPDSPSKRARIKTLLLLQSLREGKELVNDIQDRIIDGGWDKILGLEMAVLHSKIPSARTTLRTLYALRDTSTAESYASSGGSTGVISTKIGVSAAEGCGLSDWSGWFARGSGAAGVKHEKELHDGDMLKMLLEVYMEDRDTQQTTRFLSSQAKSLDVLDIFPLVPTTWPLRGLSTYLTRSLRRTQHTAHEGQIVKGICAGQNLAVLERTFEVLREEGAIVEEAVSDDEEDKQGEDSMGRILDEKVVLHGGTEGGGEAVDVHVGGDERGSMSI